MSHKYPSAPPCNCKASNTAPAPQEHTVLYIGGEFDVSLLENPYFKHFIFVNEMFDQDSETIALKLMDALDPSNLFVMDGLRSRCLTFYFHNGCTLQYFYHYSLPQFIQQRSEFLKKVTISYVNREFNPFVRNGLCPHDIPNMNWVLSRKMMMLDRRHWHDKSILPKDPIPVSLFFSPTNI
jgi:hypothetical protein